MPIYPVSVITRYLRDALDSDSLLRDLWVEGEVSNAHLQPSGHWYFTLKDDQAQLRCVMFRTGGGGRFVQSGAKVTAHGRVSLYETRGELQLYVDLVQPAGVGELNLRLELLKQRLEREGLFEASRKRPLPVFPQRIAVVTSPAGAVWHDIQNVVRRRYPLVELLLAPCQVQGENAAASIVDALKAASREPELDLVIIARGGGSLEELWPFNEESVARAIFASPVPVISGVGHETDTTIADMVADVRAPTPSAAAELAVPDTRELRGGVVTLARTLHDGMDALLEQRRASLERAVAQLRRRAPDVAPYRLRVDDLLRSARIYASGLLSVRRERLDGLTQRLGALDPRAVLQRGYAIVQRTDTGAVVTGAVQVAAGDRVHVTVAHGSFGARVA
ncbi:MAG: exodeoxyribonuclease VII large subunit [SAR202 cluster bacterium]|nr:exodeoxyribonuclease VII large subunit [SAR202 cluster bacterium]